MKKNLVLIILLSAAVLLVIHGYMYLSVFTFMKKNRWKRYKSEVPFWRRCFFLGANYVTDHYSKTEKRVVGYSLACRLFFVLTCIIHLLFFAEVIAVICFLLEVIQTATFNYVLMVYFCAGLLIFAILAIMDFSMNKKYHLTRYHQARRH